MKITVTSLIALLFMTLSTVVKAQTVDTEEVVYEPTFTDKLSTPANGQGVFEVEQDPRLIQIVDGEIIIPSTIKVVNKLNTIHTDSQVKTANSSGKTAGLHEKASGYRVQVYFGNNDRASQTAAQKAGNKVASMFPGLRVYTIFKSPHWCCRVGDFPTKGEADNYMRRIKARGIKEAIVVKSEIYVSVAEMARP